MLKICFPSEVTTLYKTEILLQHFVSIPQVGCTGFILLLLPYILVAGT